ncbi:hypothetical protein Q668_18900 [Alcanivorax sp. PN-3]|nr:hypothetical protein Q668_18900 [Alcanivorax sp. PN-3]
MKICSRMQKVRWAVEQVVVEQAVVEQAVVNN